MTSAATVRQEIDQVNQHFVAAFNRGDMAAAAAVYTEDAQVLPPDGAIVSGRTAIQQFWQGARDVMGIREGRLATRSFEASGDLGYEIGEATLVMPAGSATFKYVVVWKRGADGAWRWAVDIWNNNPAG